MKTAVLGLVCGMIISTVAMTGMSASASEQVEALSSENGISLLTDSTLKATPFDVGYFANKYINSTERSIDPNPRTKLESSKALDVTINSNRSGEPVLLRAYSPGTPQLTGPWVRLTIGSTRLPNNIPRGQKVTIQARTVSNANSTYIDGSWYHN
ncbi:hypothetical protein [Vagococcus intermedius]|uniref:Uncharacterized protein n=1 Tax=Vagococcus intermedius TaxID=2991418 RepID=A0AAF0I654_9ENTE|nr:hypothetical protein [Vagococcus intermedius]WEG72569.1 hypothetical protein OL234_06150 [Vagococcus intermedius]WEG74655.1 hypothetical protein OL235_06150 [Vagococcus intermedius]